MQKPISSPFFILKLIVVFGILASCKKDGSKPGSANGDVNVYVAGQEFNGTNYVAKYWRNGVAVNLSSNSIGGWASSIFVAGSDVYVAGNESDGKVNVANYWKNGTIVNLTDGSRDAIATAIYVK